MSDCIEDNGQTTLRLKRETRDRLAKMGTKGESFNDILTTILDFFEDKWLTEAYSEYLKSR